MNLSKNLCEKLYMEVKNKLQESFVAKGMTYRGSETFIWKLEDTKTGKTYFQSILEESTQTVFSTTFNPMYLWRKMNEAQTRETVNFQSDYLYLFVVFLGYANPQEYISEFSLTLHNFFGIKSEGKILVVQPIFDADKELSRHGKFPRANEKTLDSRDTECLIELINLFHDYNQILPKRVYDQDIVSVKDGIYTFDETNLNLNKTNCIFSIGFYSNYFFSWLYTTVAYQYIEYADDPFRFRVRYFNETMQTLCWTDYYEANDTFDCGFLLKFPVKFSNYTVNCYFFCGIENKATRAITSYLCQHWKTLQQKCDSERNQPINDTPFLMVFKIKKDNLNEIYAEKIVKLDFLA